MTQRGDASAADYEWLVNEAAVPWLALASGSRHSAALVSRLRKDLSAVQTHLVCEQAVLRHKARVKFADASRMFFTPVALEQASDEALAAYKASRFAGAARACDLCSGIGGDLLALSQRGGNAETLGVDRDPVMRLLAEANLRTVANLQNQAARVLAADVASIDLASYDAWHLDPDRRPHGRRTTHLELHEPDLPAIERMLARNRQGAIKLAPACDVPQSWQAETELEWISRDGECRQLVAWHGRLAERASQRRSTIVAHDADANVRVVRSIVGKQIDLPPPADNIGRYLHEPDAAVLAAGLDGLLAAEHALAPVARSVAYWTSDVPINDAALASFEVLEVLALDVRKLKKLLKDRGVGRLEIKKRGADIEPETLRRQLRGSGDNAATVLVFPRDGHTMAVVARRQQRATTHN